MCLTPIQIVNPSKYVSLKYKDRYLLTVPCGKCSQCQSKRSNEWFFRSYYEMLNAFENDGFVLFDTLTYDDAHLPHLRDYWPAVSDDYSCFEPHHLRTFVAALRQECKRKYGVNFSYFISSEYGTSDYYNYKGYLRRAQHRPHYHCLFFVRGQINSLVFSSLIAKHWKYGLTDGIPYKSNYYVLDNTFRRAEFARALRCCKYVSKYMQKTCVFQSELNRRITTTMQYIADRMPAGWIDSVNARRVKSRLMLHVNQFHRQSTQFGALALRDIDIDKLFLDGTLALPDPQCVVSTIPLPLYYKRKLFYKLVKVDSNPMWLPTDLGIKYLSARDKANLDYLRSQYEGVRLTYNFDFDSKKLADYVYLLRGRIKGDLVSTSPADKLQSVDLYNYVTLSDKEHLDGTGLVRHFIGNNTIGYRDRLRNKIKIKDFIGKYVYLNPYYERLLEQIDKVVSLKHSKIQDAYAIKQRLTNLFKYLNLL